MSPKRGRGRGRDELRCAFDREARRMGSMATLHNHAVASFAGLHETDQECLDLLDWTGPITAGEIGTHLGLSSGAVTGLLDRLEAEGRVHRERDVGDRRRVIVSLAHGRGADLWQVYQPLAEAIEAYRDELADRDLRLIVEFLEWSNGALADATRHARALTPLGRPPKPSPGA